MSDLYSRWQLDADCCVTPSPCRSWKELMFCQRLHLRILMLGLEPFCGVAASVLRSAQQTWIVMRMYADSWVGQDGLFHDWLNWGVHCTICSFFTSCCSTFGPASWFIAIFSFCLQLIFSSVTKWGQSEMILWALKVCVSTKRNTLLETEGKGRPRSFSVLWPSPASVKKLISRIWF